MKISFITILISLTGCGFLEEANYSLTSDKMTDYLSEAEPFSNDFPTLVENASQDPSAIPPLKKRLKEMIVEVQEINSLTPPKLAEDLHQKVEGYNDKALAGIERVLVELEKREVQISELQNLEVVKTFNQLLKET